MPANKCRNEDARQADLTLKMTTRFVQMIGVLLDDDIERHRELTEAGRSDEMQWNLSPEEFTYWRQAIETLGRDAETELARRGGVYWIFYRIRRVMWGLTGGSNNAKHS